jgi:GrpB-like predicted nucleotidyltransferase (UPF0157 family)
LGKAGNFYIRDLDRSILHGERERILQLIKKVISFALLTEVGSTAAEGVVGKQDLDFALRVPASRFYEAQGILDSHFDRNDVQRPVVGYQRYRVHSQLDVLIHLVVSGGSYDNDFGRFLEVLVSNNEVRIAYNKLKVAFNGRPMSEYKRAKKAFIESALANYSKKNNYDLFS